MKLMEFTYDNTGVGKPPSKRKVVVMNQSEYHLEGIDLSKMAPEVADEVIHLFEDMDKKLTPYMKYYRKFLKSEMKD